MKDLLTAKDRLPTAREVLAVKRCILKDWLEELEYLLCCSCKTESERLNLLIQDETASDALYGASAGWLNDLFMGKRS